MRFKLQKYFDALEENISMNSLTSRIRFQKITYLLKAFGVHVPYPFNWYLHGPYSSILADDGFALEQLGTNKRRKLAEPFDINQDKSSLQQAKEFLERLREVTPNLRDHERVEIAASLHFLANRTLRGEARCDRLIRRLERHKPEYTTNHTKKVCSLLKQFGVITENTYN